MALEVDQPHALVTLCLAGRTGEAVRLLLHCQSPALQSMYSPPHQSRGCSPVPRGRRRGQLEAASLPVPPRTP